MATAIEIGKKVKRFREKAGLNQTQIANFLDVDQSTVSKCEKGERQFSVDMLEKLGSLFGYTLSELESDENIQNSLQFAFRADGINDKDLAAIADVNQIALNLCQMQNLLEASLNEGKN